MPENKTAIISFSGGMDSTSLLMHLINKNYKIHAITFNYGQKHKIEIIKAKENIEYLKTNNYKIIHKIIDISDCTKLLSSGLTDKNISIPEGHYEDENMKATVVPNRNAIFNAIIYGYAISITKKTNSNILIALGVHAGDHTIYPDCRQEFYTQIMKAFKIGNWDTEKIALYLPYIKYAKSDILKDAIKNIDKLNLNFNTIFKNTLTSYNPDKTGKSNGKTSSDIERILAFNSLGKIDPLEYLDSWDNILINALNKEKDYKNN